MEKDFALSEDSKIRTQQIKREEIMNIYFAVNDAIVEKYGMPEKIKTAPIGWKLTSDNFLGYMIGGSPGEVLDALKNNDVPKPFAICGASINNADMANALRAAMVGDVVKSIDVVIREITLIK